MQLTPKQEAGLVRRVKEGNLKAFHQLHEAFVGRVYAICLRLTGDADRAEDISQDVFVRVWERIHQFEGRSGFGTWLYRLAFNTAVDSMRREVRRSSREVSSDAFEDELEFEDEAEETPELGMDLQQAIATLPPQARIVLVMHDIEGFQHREIAETTGMAVGTSKAHLFRARRLLRQRLSR